MRGIILSAPCRKKLAHREIILVKKRRGRRKKVEMEQDNLLIGHNDDIDMDDEETGYEGDAEDFEEEEE